MNLTDSQITRGSSAPLYRPATPTEKKLLATIGDLRTEIKQRDKELRINKEYPIMNDENEAIEVIAKWMCCGDKPDAAAKREAERLYGRLHLIMDEIKYKELRKLLNKAWEMGIEYGVWEWGKTRANRRYRRYRDVSRIIKEAKEKKDE